MKDTAASPKPVFSGFSRRNQSGRTLVSAERRRLSSLGAGLILGPISILCAIFAFTDLEYAALLGTPMGSVWAMVLSFIASFTALALALISGNRSSWGLGIATLVSATITVTDIFFQQFTEHSGLLDAASTVTGWSTFLPGLTGLYAGAWYASWKARRLGFHQHIEYLRHHDTPAPQESSTGGSSRRSRIRAAGTRTFADAPAPSHSPQKFTLVINFLPAVFFSLVIIALALWQSSGVLIAGPMPPITSSLSPALLTLASFMTFISCFGLVATSARSTIAAVISALFLLLVLSLGESFYAIMTLRVVVPGDLWAISTGLAAPLIGVLGTTATTLSLAAHWARKDGIERATTRWKRHHGLA